MGQGSAGRNSGLQLLADRCFSFASSSARSKAQRQLSLEILCRLQTARLSFADALLAARLFIGPGEGERAGRLALPPPSADGPAGHIDPTPLMLRHRLIADMETAAVGSGRTSPGDQGLPASPDQSGPNAVASLVSVAAKARLWLRVCTCRVSAPGRVFHCEMGPCSTGPVQLCPVRYPCSMSPLFYRL